MWCKSAREEVTAPKSKVTASPRGGVESNRRRTGSPQDDEPVSAGWIGEPAHTWRSLELTVGAEVTVKASGGVHRVVGGGMSGRQSGVSGETRRRG